MLGPELFELFVMGRTARDTKQTTARVTVIFLGQKLPKAAAPFHTPTSHGWAAQPTYLPAGIWCEHCF